MKKYLLFVTATILFLNAHTKAVAQVCIPNTDTTTFISPLILPPAFVGVPYNQVIYFRAPVDTTINFAGQNLTVYIDTIVVDSIIGFPAHFGVQCNPTTCKFLGGKNGCILISGLADSTQVGMYPLNLYLTIYIADSLGKPPFATLPVAVDSLFSLDIKLVTGIETPQINSFSISDPFPNPSSNSVNVIFNSAQPEVLQYFITDLSGRKIMSGTRNESPQEHVLNFDISSLNSGQYLLQFENDHGSITRTFFKR